MLSESRCAQQLSTILQLQSECHERGPSDGLDLLPSHPRRAPVCGWYVRNYKIKPASKYKFNLCFKTLHNSLGSDGWSELALPIKIFDSSSVCPSTYDSSSVYPSTFDFCSSTFDSSSVCPSTYLTPPLFTHQHLTPAYQHLTPPSSVCPSTLDSCSSTFDSSSDHQHLIPAHQHNLTPPLRANPQLAPHVGSFTIGSYVLAHSHLALLALAHPNLASWVSHPHLALLLAHPHWLLSWLVHIQPSSWLSNFGFCSFSYVIHLLLKFCSDGKNHSLCCARRNVQSKCLGFCDGLYPQALIMDCISDLSNMLACFNEGISSERLFRSLNFVLIFFIQFDTKSSHRTNRRPGFNAEYDMIHQWLLSL